MTLEPVSSPRTPGKFAYDILWFAALAAVLLVLLHKTLFCGYGLVPADAILKFSPWNQNLRPSNFLLADQYWTFLPAQEFVHQQKSLPLWNPFLCCGAPNLGNIQEALLFPIRLLLSPLGPFKASGPAAFLKLCLAGWFMMLYVRLLGVSRPAASLAGLVFSLSGFMIVWLGHPHVNCAMWLPLLLYFMEEAFRREPAPLPLRWWAGFSVAFACAILGGHPPTAIHVTFVVVLYFVFRQMDGDRKHALPRTCLFVGSLALALLLAAPQILPFLEYYRQSSSVQALAPLERWSAHLSLSSLIHFLLPNALGSPALGYEDMPARLGWPETANFNERTGYVGIIPLFLAACAIVLRRCRFTKFFLSMAVASILVIFRILPFDIVARALPIFCNVDETRLLLVVGFSVAALSALGWDEFAARTGNCRRKLILVARFFALVGLALFCFWCVIGPHFHTLDASYRDFFWRQFSILAGGMLAVLFLALWPADWKSWMPTAVCLGWTAVDLLCFATDYNPAIPRSLYYPSTPAIQWLQKDKSQFRVFGGGTMLPPNTAEIFGLSDARGCDFMTVKRYEMLVTGKADEFFFYRNPDGIPSALRLLNVKYLFGEKPLPLDARRFELVYSNDILIYRSKECLERALIVFNHQVEPDAATILERVSNPAFDPRRVVLLEYPPPLARIAAPALSASVDTNSSVRIRSYEPDLVKIDAFLPRPGYLLLLDTYFPGWTATANGEPAPILRADYNFRAVPLPPGKSTVCFSYRPQSLRIGLYLFGAGAIALGVMFFIPLTWNKPRSTRLHPG